MSKAELTSEVLADLMTMHQRTSGTSSGGVWAQGISSHHTVAKREGKEDYHIANFHHADDASFIDQAHKYVPLLIERVRALDASHQRLVEALDMARDLLVDLEGYEPEGPSVSVIDAALEQAKDLS